MSLIIPITHRHAIFPFVQILPITLGLQWAVDEEGVYYKPQSPNSPNGHLNKMHGIVRRILGLNLGANFAVGLIMAWQSLNMKLQKQVPFIYKLVYQLHVDKGKTGFKRKKLTSEGTYEFF